MSFDSMKMDLKYRKVIPEIANRYTYAVDPIFVLQATIIGNDASERIFGNQLNGYVHSVFQHAMNIILDDGYFLSILDEGYQSIPFGISVSIPGKFSFKNLVEADEPVFSIDNSLIVGNVKIELDRKITSKKIPVELLNPDFSVAKNNIPLILNILQSQSKRNGFYPIFPTVQSFLFTTDLSDNSLDPICFYASTQIKFISQYFSEENADECLKPLKELIGLGVGLTPSGDDFLLGFFGLFLKLKTIAFNHDFIDRIKEQIAYFCVGKTTLISEVYLTYGLKGQITEVLSGFINSLFCIDQHKLKKNTQNLLNVGSSSGMDLILGCLFALQLNLTKLKT